MNIAIIGYGKMGRMIETIAESRGHQIVSKINSSNRETLSKLSKANTDAAIEFTQPKSALENYTKLLELGIPIITGTTGWHDKKEEVAEMIQENNGSFFYASNFSIGVNLFFELNKKLAQLIMAQGPAQVDIEETHHLEKKDAPSGTAITLAEQIIENNEQVTNWKLEDVESEEDISIKSFREADVIGDHKIKYTGQHDLIQISHRARDREGFALGAVLAAEWIQGKKGVFTMSDMLSL